MHCIHACVGELICTAYQLFLATGLKLLMINAVNNRKTKPMVETKTAQYVHDIELHFTEKEKRTQTRKLKDFYRNQKDVGL